MLICGEYTQQTKPVHTSDWQPRGQSCVWVCVCVWVCKLPTIYTNWQMWQHHLNVPMSVSMTLWLVDVCFDFWWNGCCGTYEQSPTQTSWNSASAFYWWTPYNGNNNHQLRSPHHNNWHWTQNNSQVWQGLNLSAQNEQVESWLGHGTTPNKIGIKCTSQCTHVKWWTLLRCTEKKLQDHHPPRCWLCSFEFNRPGNRHIIVLY